MQDDTQLNPELQALEARLAGLTPKPAALDRDRLMYEAGRTAASRTAHRWAWPAATAACTLLALAIGGIAGRAGRPVIDVAPIAVQGPSSEAVATGSPDEAHLATFARAALDSPDGYLSLRRRLVTTNDLSAALTNEPRAEPAPLPTTRQDWLRALN